jgi:hypothetical protein|tara:strand:+ start:1281 stop:1475 length:195 start_codon:yes stop_codon:yes gene_type:complete
MAFPQNPIYKLSKDLEGNVTVVNKATELSDEGYMKISIPFAEDNTDYQEYLEWVAKGNTAEAAD